MLVSETEYKHQVEADIRPFHDVLLGLFFITIGMMLDWHQVLGAGRWCWCCCWCRCFKLLLVAALARALGASAGVALRTGLYLAQAGEFGFVLLTLGARRPGGARAGQPVLAAMVLSMLATPFIIMYSNRIVMRLVASDWLQQSLQMTTSRRIHQHQRPRAHLRLRPQRPEPGPHAGARGHPLHGAGPGPRPRAQAAPPAGVVLATPPAPA
jgi:CPA2 family monovalent cation:H+ antiporter-2